MRTLALAIAPIGGVRAAIAGGPLPAGRRARYRGAGYSFAYPAGWRILRADRPVTSYRETELESADGAAMLTVDFSPGETADPASKAAQVEAATARTPGYHRVSFGPATVAGGPAFAWDFTVADADPRRVDLFLSKPAGGFALLAHGRDFARAQATARWIAGTVSPTG